MDRTLFVIGETTDLGAIESASQIEFADSTFFWVWRVVTLLANPRP
jgi:hypothetical protein